MYFYLYYIPAMKIIEILNNHDMITIGYDYNEFDMPSLQNYYSLL